MDVTSPAGVLRRVAAISAVILLAPALAVMMRGVSLFGFPAPVFLLVFVVPLVLMLMSRAANTAQPADKG